MPARSIPHRRYLAILGGILAVWWLVLAIAPVDRSVWLLENGVAMAFVALVGVFHRKLLLSRVSYTLIFAFLCLHLVGAHYTYPKVPYDEWFAALFGMSLNELMGWERNHYDRALHFAYGLCLAYPIREMFLRVVQVRGFWGYFLPLDLTMSTSMLFELLEWTTTIVFGGGVGQEYVGTQGDEWDAHKDMALASLGALIAMCVTCFVNWRFQRDFAREWTESLRVKDKRPLGEDELARMTKDGKNGKNGKSGK